MAAERRGSARRYDCTFLGQIALWHGASGRPPNEIVTDVHSSVSDLEWRDKLLIDARDHIAVLAFNGFAVRYSRSAIFFISDFFSI